jgi:flagellar hook-associated protein 2
MEIAGIDADQIVSSLMQIERRPLGQLTTRKDAATTASQALDRMRSAVDAFRLAAARISNVSTFDRFSATVSAPDVISASVSATASAGSLSMTVDRLAQAHGLRSTGTVAASSAPVTLAANIAVATGVGKLGIGTVRSGAGLGVGKVDLTVTQESLPPGNVGIAPLGDTSLINGSNNTIELNVNGAAHTATIAAGTYDRAGLAAAVNSALASTGATATLDSSGALAITTSREGSAASLQITGGNALAGLQLATDATAQFGTDGKITANGVETTLTSIQAGSTTSLATGAGDLDVTFSGGLRLGERSVQVVPTGDRSLAGVAAAITGAGAGVSAAAVRVGDNAWRLQLTSATTGQDGRLSIAADVFNGGLGGLVESSAAQNAQITIGSGPGAYSVEASGNTFDNLMTGVSLTAKTVSATPVNVQVGRNNDAVATDVAALVSAANTLLADIRVQTRFDVANRTSGPLAGNSTIRRLADQVRQAIAGPLDSGSTPASIGIQLTRDGSFTFDRAAFVTAANNDPAAVAQFLARGGTSTGPVQFAGADGNTVRGSYDVNVTTPATRATSAVKFAGGAASDARIGVRVGAVTVNYDVSAGQTPSQIIDGLNTAIGRAGLKAVAEVDGTGLVVRATTWGAAGNFELNTDVTGAGTWNALSGTDVAGTINGLAATGTGQTLSLPAVGGNPAAGLSVTVTGTSPGVTTVDYRPGAAARVVELANALTRAETGTLTSAKEFADRRVKDFNDQISRLEDRLSVRELNFRRQYSNLQTMISGLQTQGNWLSGQLANL